MSTALGPVECSIRGRGTAVLIIPGCPGGFDQGLLAGRLLASPGLRLISVSRPGYLRTPLGAHHAPEAQADVYAALLDGLGIEHAAVIGVSGGGPSALQFVLRHPHRCLALTTLAAISQRMTPAELNNCRSLTRRVVGAARCVSYLCGHYFARAVGLSRVSNLPEFYQGLLRAALLIRLHRRGLENDTGQLLTLPVYPLRKISVPTLVMHGTNDTVVPHAHAELLAREVPNVTRISFPDAGHLFFAQEHHHVIPEILAFIERHSNSSKDPKTPGGPVEVDVSCGRARAGDDA